VPVAHEYHLAENINIVLTSDSNVTFLCCKLIFAEIMKWCMLGENHVPYVFAGNRDRRGRLAYWVAEFGM
jgi:hypothetical protein